MIIANLKNKFYKIKVLGLRENIKLLISAGYTIMEPYITISFLRILLQDDSGIVGVMSGSMEPGFFRGDILLLSPKEFDCGDILVFKVDKFDVSVVHRIIKVDYKKKEFLTKGDNNYGDDIPLYDSGKKRLTLKDCESRIIGTISHLGMPSVLLGSIPYANYIVLFLSVISSYLSFSNF